MMIEGDVERVGGRVRIGRRRGWGRLALALCTAAALWGGRELWLPDVGKETGTPVFQELGAEAARASRPSRSRLFSAWAASFFSFSFRLTTSAAVTRPRWRLSKAQSGR